MRGGIALCGRLTDAALKSTARQLPVMATSRLLKAPGLFSRAFDNLAGGRMATRHRVELGRLAATAMRQLLAVTTPTVVVPAPRLIARDSSRRMVA